MDRGLSEKYTDKVSPVKDHFNHMEKLGVKPGLINPRLNQITSDVVKVTLDSKLCLQPLDVAVCSFH